MSDKELYEIEYTLLGEHHVDIIENLDVPIIEVVHELALKHHVELDELPMGEAGLPLAAGISIAADLDRDVIVLAETCGRTRQPSRADPDEVRIGVV